MLSSYYPARQGLAGPTPARRAAPPYNKGGAAAHVNPKNTACQHELVLVRLNLVSLHSLHDISDDEGRARGGIHEIFRERL